MRKTSLRLFTALSLLPSGFAPAAAGVVVGAAARSATVAPAPLAGFRAPLLAPSFGAPSLIAPSLNLDAGLPASLPTLEAGLPALSATAASPLASVAPSAPAKASAAPRTLKALPGSPAAASPINRKNPVRASLSAQAEKTAPQAAKGLTAARLDAGRLFDGTGDLRRAVNAADARDWRNPDWSEDRRINRALETLYRSASGTDLYNDIRRNHAQLRIRVDTDRNSNYDARMRWEDGNPVLYLTESLVDNESKEAVAAYIAREFTDLYFNDFPASVELNYVAHGTMLRVFAELTDSGRARYGYWWDRSKDQRVGNAYAMESYYGSWKKAVYEKVRDGVDVGRSEFFEYLRDQDLSNKDPNSRKTLRQHYREGNLTYDQYRRFARQFADLTEAEAAWFGDTGRW